MTKSGLQTQTCKFMLARKPENLHRLETETEYCVNLEFRFAFLILASLKGP